MAAISSSVATSCPRDAPNTLRLQRAVADEEAGVDAQPAIERVQVLAEGGPGPGHAVLECGQGHPLDLGHHATDVVRVLGVDRGQREPAVPADHRGDAVDVRGRRDGVPEQLGVVVRVRVDDAGGHHEPGGVELGLRRLVDHPDGSHAAVPDAHVGPDRVGPGPVDERAGADGVIEHGTSGSGRHRHPGGGCGQEI